MVDTMTRLVSVPHTGTTFVAWKLQERGVAFDWQHVEADMVTDERLVVSPVRDPMLQVCSCLNRNQKIRPEWFRYLAAMETDDTVYIRVDGSPDQHREDLARFNDSIDAPPANLVWTPRNTSRDVTGAKAAYLSGEWWSLFDFWAGRIARQPGVVEFYERRGYELPWMHEVAA